MRTIGMLGGMSWESTAEYYRLINQLVQDQLGGVHSARILLDSLDFADVAALQSAGQWDQAGDFLATRAQRLEAAGADMIVLCTNTMHKVADVIEQAVSIPLIHIADAVATSLLEQGVTKAGLLGTAFTMEEAFYRNRLASHGIETIIPNEADRHEVHRIIYEELVRGIVNPDSRKTYQRIMSRLVNNGVAGMILGCTEIELLVGQDDSAVPVFPSTRIHAEAAVNAALKTK